MAFERFDAEGRPIRCKLVAEDYEICWRGDPWSREANALGQHDGANNRLTLAADREPTQAATTFIHEIFHGLMTVMDRQLTELTVEEACQLLAPLLTAFCRDNPETVRWWLGLITENGGQT